MIQANYMQKDSNQDNENQDNENQDSENQDSDVNKSDDDSIMSDEPEEMRNDSSSFVQSFEYLDENELEEITEIDEINRIISLEDAVIHTQKLISAHERYADFIEFRNSIIDDPYFINYDWFEDIIQITEGIILRQLELLEIKKCDDVILQLRG